MEQMNSNPLQKYFRNPGLTVKLPSMGRFQQMDNVRFTATGELPILPMRAADEMVMKSPDALMSGMAMEQIIRSCVPDVKDPMQLPSPDVDAILLAIRAATYGNMMTVECECPACKFENAYEFDVTAILETVTPLQDEYSVRLTDEIIVYLRPFNLENSTKASTMVFQETRKLQLLDQDTSITADIRQKAMNESYKRLNHMNIQMVADCVEKVVTPDGVVVERQHISEFIHNIQRNWVAALEDELKKVNEAGLDKTHGVSCVKCNHEWETVVEFDPSNFFGPSS